MFVFDYTVMDILIPNGSIETETYAQLQSLDSVSLVISYMLCEKRGFICKKIYWVRSTSVTFWRSWPENLGSGHLLRLGPRRYIWLCLVHVDTHYYSGFRPNTFNQSTLAPMHLDSDLIIIAHWAWPIPLSILVLAGFSLSEQGEFLDRETIVRTGTRWEAMKPLFFILH